MLPHLTWKVLPFKKFLMKFAIRPLKPALWIFISSAVLLTLSNAFLRSRNTANVCFLAWNPLCMESIIWTRLSAVQRPGRKPFCSSIRILFDSRWDRSRRFIILSNNLEAQLVREIGR